MTVDTNQLLFENRNYKDPHHRIMAQEKKGLLIPLKRGLYETDPDCPGYLLANHLAGPSYLSFEYALSWYGMIPERVNVYSSAVFDKRKQLKFTNKFGVFTYRDIPKEVFPYYYTQEMLAGRTFLIATREKALCDYLSKLSPVRGLHNFEDLLFDGVRLDEEIFYELEHEKIRRIAPLYHKTNLDQLIKLLEKRGQQ